MAKPLPLPPASPFRAAVDQLLEQLVTSLLAALNPMERAFLNGAITRRGWGFAALSRSGPLSGVNDAALLVLLEQLSDRIDRVLVEDGGTVETPLPSEAEAVASLKRSLAGR